MSDEEKPVDNVVDLATRRTGPNVPEALEGGGLVMGAARFKANGAVRVSVEDASGKLFSVPLTPSLAPDENDGVLFTGGEGATEFGIAALAVAISVIAGKAVR